MGNKQKGRKLRLLKNKAQCALWFSQSFGLELSQIKLHDKYGFNYTLDYQRDKISVPGLSNNDKHNLETILFLLDEFCISDDVYYELTMQSEGLPKSYLLKQLRTNLNKTYHITRTGGKCHGAKLNFTSTCRAHVQELLLHKPELKSEVIQVKLSVGSAVMYLSTNFIMISFALLQSDEKVLSSKSNVTKAIINGPEKYNTLKESLPDVPKEINELIKSKAILIDEKVFKLEFFLGVDMKFLLIMGLPIQHLIIRVYGVKYTKKLMGYE